MQLNAAKSYNIFNAVLKRDPTRTLTLRKKFEADLVRRFKIIRRDITRAIVDTDVFALKPPSIKSEMPLQNRGEFAGFNTTDGKVSEFMDWLNEREDLEILELPAGSTRVTAKQSEWYKQYMGQAYEQGTIRGHQELINAGYPVVPFDDVMGGVSSTLASPVNIDRVSSLYSRTFSELKGITNAMDQQISRELAQGLIEGKGPLQIAQKLTSIVGLDGTKKPKGIINRARVLARTEIIRAHHQGTIQEYKAAQVQGVKILAEFTTAGDSRVCPICKSLAAGGKNNDGIYTLNEAEGLIPAHPNCRCVALPVDVTDL